MGGLLPPGLKKPLPRILSSLFIGSALCVAAGASLGFVPLSHPASAARQNVLSQPAPEEEGDLMMDRGNYSAAIDAYRQGPLNSAVVWNKLGVAYQHLYAFDLAAAAYRKAIEIDPHSSAALDHLAAIYDANGEHKQADRLYKLALRYEADSGNPLS